MDKLKYINNDITNGIEYNYSKVSKLFHKVLKETMGANINSIFVPEMPLNKADWFIEMSERSVGKTTQYLLFGLCLNKYYGTKIEYIRDKYEQIAPKNASQLFATILNFDYISKIFDNKYNSLEYVTREREWYLVRRNEKGEIEEKDLNGVCHMHSLDNVDNTKSSYNSPKGDWCLYDEAIPVNGVTNENNFVALIQLLSTITRMRLSCKMIVNANTINKYTKLFKELLISDSILSMKIGDEKIVHSPKGVALYVHLIKFDNETTDKRKKRNLRFYGFDNPRLNSIIGGSEWETFAFPHIPKGLKYNVICDNIFFEYAEKFLQFKICQNIEVGLFALVLPYTGKTDYPRMRIYTLDEAIFDKRMIYGLGTGKRIERLIERLLKSKKVFYATNTEGNLLNQYLKEINVKLIK